MLVSLAPADFQIKFETWLPRPDSSPKAALTVSTLVFRAWAYQFGLRPYRLLGFRSKYSRLGVKPSKPHARGRTRHPKRQLFQFGILQKDHDLLGVERPVPGLNLVLSV